MDARRRAGLQRPPSSGSFTSGMARSSSASRRKPGAESHSPLWSKDHRPAHHGLGPTGGLSRQASAPTLAPQKPQGPHGGHNMSFDSFHRGSPQGPGYDSMHRSPAGTGLRRNLSATSIGARFGTPNQRPGASSVPRRRPYESALQPPSYASPLDRSGFGSSPALGTSMQHRADALQLESRLTERLREHSLSSAEATRRPTSAAGAADPRRRAPAQYSASPWQEGSFHHSGYPQRDQRLDPTDSRAANSPGTYSKGAAGNWQQDYRGMKPSSSVPSLMQKKSPDPNSSYGRHRRTPTPSKSYEQFADASGMGPHAVSAALPESRLKIYSDLFEEVIERDRVFGSLLRKIKTAYDMLLIERPEPGMVPPLPQGNMPPGGEWSQDARGGGQHSNEPTTRADDGQAWEMHRENRVLKDLVERLHLELEEAVKREHAWKQKVAKLKSRQEPAARPPSQLGFAHSMPSDAYGPGEREYQVYAREATEQWDEWTGHGRPQGPEDGHMGHPGSHVMGGHGMMPGPGGKSYAFGAMRREPGPGDLDGHDALLNQGGLLSMSSISPQNSAPLPQDLQGEGASGLESARSADSGHLPQRPTRRQVVKPAHVPALDFSRLNQAMDEEEEEELQDEEDHELEMGEDEGLHDEEDDRSDRSADQEVQHLHQQHLLQQGYAEAYAVNGRPHRAHQDEESEEEDDDEMDDDENAYVLPKDSDGMPRRGNNFQHLLEAEM